MLPGVQPKEKQFTIVLLESELNLIASGLGKLPLEAAIGVFNQLQFQATEQLKAEAKQNENATDTESDAHPEIAQDEAQ